jgi:hypothetical protein
MPSQAGTEGLPRIPAMTTDAERECYYRLAKEAASKGAIVELGAWLGASTAYIAAGIRDSGVETKAQVYDKFVSRPGHIRKVKEFYSKRNIDKAPIGPSLMAFRENLGRLFEYVEPHQGQIEALRWGDEPIALLISDAPKRVPYISPVLTKFRKALQPGSIMAWQDFCHFPSFEIPACLYRIRHHLEFVEAVVPGTTLVFRVRSQWGANEVTPNALSLNAWSVGEIDQAWAYWDSVVAPEKRSLFRCGAALFLCDIGEPDDALDYLAHTFVADASAIVKKWRYLRENRPNLVTRYAPLFQYLERQGVFETETV